MAPPVGVANFLLAFLYHEFVHDFFSTNFKVGKLINIFPYDFLLSSHAYKVLAHLKIILKNHTEGFPGGAVVRNPPANAGDMGSSPGPGRSHMPWSNSARAPQRLSLRSRAHEAQLLSPRATTTEACAPRVRAPQQERPLRQDARALQRRVAPARCNERKAARNNEDPMQPKINTF